MAAILTDKIKGLEEELKQLKKQIMIMKLY